MLKFKGQNINQLLLYKELFIFYALKTPDLFLNVLKRQKISHLKKKR